MRKPSAKSRQTKTKTTTKTKPTGNHIGIWAGPAWEVWDLNSYRTTGLGGSETCAGRLAQTAAANGNRVTLFGEHIRASQDGVDLVPWREFDARDWEFDLFIASRALAPITPELRASKVLVWAHDCMLLSGQEISAAQRGMVDKFICLSPWHAQHFAQYHGLNESEITLIPNGVNVELFKPPQLKSKVFGKLIWSSSSDRGLDNVLYCLPWIKDRIPEVHLDIYNDYQVWEKLNKARGDEEAARRLGELQDNIARASEYAHWKGRVSQPELAKAWHEAYIWGYPTAWAETYCITAKEAQVSATPIVCSNAAALQTTVGEHGLRIEEDPYSVEGRTKFINAITMLCRDRETWEMFSEYSLGGAYRVDWKSRWEDYWQHWLPAAATRASVRARSRAAIKPSRDPSPEPFLKPSSKLSKPSSKSTPKSSRVPPCFSVVLIARNEARNLPRLFEGLQEFLRRGGEVLLVDTGSTDDTVRVAREAGARVELVDDRFASTLSKKQARKIDKRFARKGEGPLTEAGLRLFHFGEAREYAQQLASNDIVLQVDGCDELLAFDVDFLDQQVRQSKARGFTYQQYYGTARLQIGRFHDRRLSRWTGRVHEAMYDIDSIPEDAPPIVTCSEEQLAVRHHRDDEKSRSYLPGLALQAIAAPDDPRWKHYLGRELFYEGRHHSAIALLQEHAAMPDAWITERSASLCIAADCYKALDQPDKAHVEYSRAFALDSSRREPLLQLALMCQRKDDFQGGVAYAAAALEIPRTNPFAEADVNYTHLPHAILYWGLFWLGRRDEARRHWEECHRMAPDDAKFAHDAVFFAETPQD